MPGSTIFSEDYDLDLHWQVAQAFHFGTESYEVEIADFILNVDERKIKDTRKEPGFIKLFYVLDGDQRKYVGYSSLGVTKWQIEGSNHPEFHLHVPYFGITRDGQSLSQDLPFEQRYSNQAAKILLHEMRYRLTELFREKQLRTESGKELANFMSLCVKKSNVKAYNFWTRHGFTEIERIDPKTGDQMLDDDLIYMIRFFGDTADAS